MSEIKLKRSNLASVFIFIKKYSLFWSKSINPILHRLFLLSHYTGGGHIDPPSKIELISFLKTASYTFSCSLSSNDQFPINFMTTSFLNFLKKKVWKISKNLRNDITKKNIFFSRIHFFFISCPILVGFSLLYLKLAFLTFLSPKKRFFAKMRKFFKISANFFFGPPLRRLGADMVTLSVPKLAQQLFRKSQEVWARSEYV